MATGLRRKDPSHERPRTYRGELWLLNSGTGFFGKVERRHGTFEPVTFCPGYLRCLAFSGNYALVGLSRPRHDRTFSGLALDEGLARRTANASFGLNNPRTCWPPARPISGSSTIRSTVSPP